MPIYEFKCEDCEHEFEELILRSGEVDQLVCPKCQGKVTQQLSTFSSSTEGASSHACSPRGGFT